MKCGVIAQFMTTRAGPYYNVHGNTGTMFGNDKKIKYYDRIWVKRACGNGE